MKPIALNPEIKKPLAMQLADVLRSGVVHGAWKVGDVLPGIHELAAQCRVSEKVPRKALAILADEGWIDPKRGVGSVVIERG
ncbi:MAG: GntR family transcriptional regulator, partial [Kiritimatiellae bacterium]|nr:GntR family transcriptional regulator [Kiritimatiellia bacterium]